MAKTGELTSQHGVQAGGLLLSGIITHTGMNGETINENNFSERFEFVLFIRSHRIDSGASDGV